MSHRIDSDALDELFRTLGIAGGGVSAGDTLLDSGNVSLVLSVNEIVRRSRTPGVSAGSFFGVLQNVHAAAGQEQASIDPYEAGDDAVAPYPPSVPRGFDVWLLGAALHRVSGAGTLDGAILFVGPDSTQQAFGRDDSGATVLTSDVYPVALWTTLNTTTTNAIGVAGNGSTFVRIGLRLKRGGTVVFVSDVAGAAATIMVQLVIGLFPAGIGQDASQ